MILHYMSASRIKTYIQCPNKYHEQYENKVKSEAIHLTFGTMIHTVFERFLQEGSDITEIYENEWNKADIADPDFFRDGYSIIENFRRMNEGNECVPIGFEMPFAIDILNGVVYDASVVDYDKNPEGSRAFLKTLEELEAPIVFGFIDRIDYDMDNDILKIIDYKTSRIPLTQYEANEDVQLSMYALVAKYMFPEYARVREELHYVRDGIPVVTTRSDEQLELFKKWLLSIYYKIKNDTTHEATLNKYCGWCEAKGNCREYQELINGEAEELVIDGLSDDELETQLEKIAIHAKILDGRKKEIEANLKGKLRSNDNAGIKTSRHDLYLTPNLRISYDVATIIHNLPQERLGEFLTVKKTEVDKVAKGNEELLKALQSTQTNYYIEPTLRKSKRKD